MSIERNHKISALQVLIVQAASDSGGRQVSRSRHGRARSAGQCWPWDQQAIRAYAEANSWDNRVETLVNLFTKVKAQSLISR